MKRTRVIRDDQGGDRTGTQLEIDGKTYTAVDIKSLLDSAATATQKTQQAQKILDAAKSYGVEPDEFLQHAEGAITVINSLREKGIVAEDGSIVEPKPKPIGDVSTDDDELDITKFLGTKPKGKVDDATKGILDVLTKITTRIDGLEKSTKDTGETQNLIARLIHEDKIRGAYPELEDTDISKVFAITAEARRQGKKATLMDAAKLVSSQKKEKVAAVEKAFAEKHGLNYEEIIKPKESPKDFLTDEGMAVITSGRKLSLFPKDKSKEVSPLEAAQSLDKHLR